LNVQGAGVNTGTVSDPTSEAAKSSEKAKAGQELADAVAANSEAQDYNEKTKPVKAQVVMQEPAAMIASGTGDLDTTGGCCDVPHQAVVREPVPNCAEGGGGALVRFYQRLGFELYDFSSDLAADSMQSGNA